MTLSSPARAARTGSFGSKNPVPLKTLTICHLTYHGLLVALVSVEMSENVFDAILLFAVTVLVIIFGSVFV
jgi:hypothetical protein